MFMAAHESAMRHGLSLHDLPQEILQHIAAYVADKPSLHAFACASKTCNNATAPAVFRNIQLEVRNPEKLQQDVDSLLSALSRTESTRHVRSLRLDGALRLRLDWLPGQDHIAKAWYKLTGRDEVLPQEDPVLSAELCRYVPGPVVNEASKGNKAWAPVASLIKSMPGLELLVYNCGTQFPPALLDALHEHPQCKLDHLTYRFQSDLPDSLHPHELAIATSPRLHRVKFKCCLRDSAGRDDFTQEAMLELVGRAPALKEVELVHLMPARSLRYNLPRGPWPGLPGFEPGDRGRGSLSSLSFSGFSWAWQPGVLQAWAQHTDFSCLHHLGLGGSNEREDGISAEIMDWIVQNCSFPRVRTLRVRLDRTDMMVARPEYADTAVAFFNLFEPLYELSVYGSLEPKIMDAILSRHGPVLQKLCLRPSEEPSLISSNDLAPTQQVMPMTFGTAQFRQIQDQCPELRELTIPVKRTKSDSTEVETYKSFGRMERLESLFLILDCSNWRVCRDSTFTEEGFDEADHEFCDVVETLKKGHIREAYMNCAVDETLARAIWNTICQNKKGAQMQALKLWTTGAGEFGGAARSSDTSSVVGNLSRSWLFERVGDRTNVRELGRRAREERDQEALPESSEAVQIFRRIWPRKEEGSEYANWREDWASLPLED